MATYTCYCCSATFEWDKSRLGAGYVFCGGCEPELSQMVGYGKYSNKEPGWVDKDGVSDLHNKYRESLEALKTQKAHAAHVNRLIQSVSSPAQPKEDIEEIRLRSILTRPADKSHCICGIHREECTYHKPAPLEYKAGVEPPEPLYRRDPNSPTGWVQRVGPGKYVVSGAPFVTGSIKF